MSELNRLIELLAEEIRKNAIKEVEESEEKGNILRIYRDSVRANILAVIHVLSSWHNDFELEQFELAKTMFPEQIKNIE